MLTDSYEASTSQEDVVPSSSPEPSEVAVREEGAITIPKTVIRLTKSVHIYMHITKKEIETGTPYFTHVES